MTSEKFPCLQEDLRALLNAHSRGGVSGTPDHLLAQYLLGCLQLFEQIMPDRDRWRGLQEPRDTRYPWKLAPAWATCATTEASGIRYWWAREPHLNNNATLWNGTGVAMDNVDQDRAHCADWQDSLEWRPGQKEGKDGE
jgi:hypothetical protein